MSVRSRTNFVKQLQENQNIIHKICRLYTNGDDAHKDLFQEITIQLWKAFPKFRRKFFDLGLSSRAEYGDYFVPKTKRSINTVEFEGRQHSE
jgi:RNA polymerase sigma-70 factor (ECF subfamily)